ncbi:MULTISPECIES: TetR/AcrR family transcriptional regulator [Rhizobium]|uniref:TetR/AcrR family transcriptional regulator n=1 Tax=Rhizobium rhododendri TaxID=2506430 RepID=A0ABY8IRI7_9HYPH|nr:MULTISPECIES: TetR/AcrR family transcriptional regulator [Rhizobium]TQX84012.1 TetR/AcrR family transcriptional regulator [Rhizobium sp. rho-13.1]TQY06648.1 TetR/AcrR family transcriptional regulator [Rhizobium sp. rho-1.1]WFS26184.1 TetR/AcrR family transcriptional regulator [Rhizobium rhododendri]
MAIQSTTREKLISEGMRQLLAHGYEGIGIGPILTSVKVPKGSFYHFFKSKDDYVVAIIEAYEEKYRAVREAIFNDTSISPLSRFDEYFAVLEREITDEHPSGGCLYGVIAQTVTSRNPTVSTKLSASYRQWEDSIRQLLALAQSLGQIDKQVDVDSAAVSVVDAYEGTLIRMKATGDTAAFKRFRKVAIPRLVGALPD